MSQPAIRQFATSDGYCFRYRHWQPSGGRPCGYVVALHGIQSHSGWYEYSSRRICQSGYEVFFLDRRGSGLNEQDRGHAPHADRLVNDVAQFLAEVRHRGARLNTAPPIVLMGISWGGKLAAVAAARRAGLIDALALLYPGICPRVRPSLRQRGLLCLALALGTTRRKVRIPLDDPALFTNVPTWQQFIREDDLALHEATVGFLGASVALDAAAERAGERIICPVLMTLAGHDSIIDNEETRRYFNRIASQQKTLIDYPHAAHTLEFEPDRERFVDDMLEWLNSLQHVSQ